MVFISFKLITILFVSIILAIVSSDETQTNQAKPEEFIPDQQLTDNINQEYKTGEQTNKPVEPLKTYPVKTQVSNSGVSIPKQLSVTPKNSRYDSIRSDSPRASVQKSDIIKTALPKSDTSKLPQTGQPKTQDELFRTLSKSKASVWVDTNKGNIFSTSIGSSHLERDKEKQRSNNDPNGHSKNMLLTLLIQPESSEPISAVPPQSRESNLKPILLLLQQQQDLSEILLEKEEKLEKMNVHLQQQIKHQHVLIVELLEQIKLFLEVLNVPSYRGEKLAASRLNEIKGKIVTRDNNNKDPHLTSSSSSANAVVMAPKTSKDVNKKANDPGSGEPAAPIEPLPKNDNIGQIILENIPTETNHIQIDNNPTTEYSIPYEPADNVNGETPIAQEPPLVANQNVAPNKSISGVPRTTISPYVSQSRDKLRYEKKVKPILAESSSEVKGNYRKPITELKTDH